MKRRRLLKLIGLGLVPLCGLQFLDRSDADSLSNTGTLSAKHLLNHGGQPRSYRVYVPDPLPPTCAAVLLLHGHGGSADQVMGVAGRKAPYRLWMSIADREGLILIIPDGLVAPDGKQGWNDARNLSSINPVSDDVDFLMNLVETVSESYPIEFNRVYATGTSNGGQMSLRLAAEVPDKLAAVAAVVATNPDPIFARRPQQSISVMLMNGTNDRFSPYDGGSVIDDRGRVQSTDDSIQYWVTHNGCEENPSEIQYDNRSNVDGCTASRTTYKHATTNVEVALVRILNGGHTEPSIQQPYSRLYLAVVGRQNRDIEMADEVWKFFQGKSVSSEPLS